MSKDVFQFDPETIGSEVSVRHYPDVGQGVASIAITMRINNLQMLYIVRSDEPLARHNLAELHDFFEKGARAVDKMLFYVNDGDKK